MGASQSNQFVNRTRMEQQEDDVPPLQPDEANRIKPYIPRGPPTMQRLETFEEKAYRKFMEQPLVPIGCMVTAYFLGSGIKSFYQRDSARSQKMMRARVGAQFATLLTFVIYMGTSSFDLTLAPMYQASKKRKEEQQQTEQASQQGGNAGTQR
mmetsp:Transcript_19200/g.34763  ORF Transcript_19200/g.34763 Transcript_19200/m.34763 type:complete len:153 (+) Transcript_19200:95-553(+)